MADSFSLLKAKRTWREKRVVFQPNGRTKTMWVKRDHTGKVKTETPLQLVPHNPSTSVPVGPILGEAVPESTPGSSYSAKKAKLSASWEECSQEQFKAYRESHGFIGTNCSFCGVVMEEKLRCRDCGPVTFYCKECCDKVHSVVLYHKPTIWKQPCFVSYDMACVDVALSGHQECQPLDHFKQKMWIVDTSGRFHVWNITLCRNESTAATLLRYDLWPASPSQPKMAFSLRLMEELHLLQMEAQISIKAYASYLHRISLNTSSQLYRSLVNQVVDHYRVFYNNTLTFRDACPLLDDGTQCPACPNDSSTLTVISVDANFGLVRKKSAGDSHGAPKFEGKFFLHQETVDERIAVRPKVEKSEEGKCSEFKAGNALRSKVRANKLDETAVFGSACKHEFPKVFCSIKDGGEKLEYSLEILEKLKMEIGDQKLLFMYDIACVLQPYLQRRAPHLLDNVTLAVPVFHGYAHRLKCQVLYNPRRVDGAGLTDGECMERLWSYLRKFSKMTKEMTSDNRVDVLSCALFHYSRLQMEKIGETLVTRMHKAQSTFDTSTTTLQDVLQNIHVPSDAVKVWADEEIALYTTSKDSGVTLSWKEEYVVQLHRLYALGSMTSSTPELSSRSLKSKLEARLKALEKKNKVSQRWPANSPDYIQNLLQATQKESHQLLIQLWRLNNERHFLATLMKRYADGQGIASRLSRSMKKIHNDIALLVQKYNDLQGRIEQGTPITVQHVCDKAWSGWAALENLYTQRPVSPSQSTPINIRRDCIDLWHRKERSNEEISMIKIEMINVINWFMYQHSLVITRLNELDASSPTLYNCGVKNDLIVYGHYLEQKIMNLLCLFDTHVITRNLHIPSYFSDIMTIISDPDLEEILGNMSKDGNIDSDVSDSSESEEE